MQQRRFPTAIFAYDSHASLRVKNQVYVFQDGVGAADYGYLCGSNLGAFASRKATRRKMTCVGIHVFPFENLMPKTLKSSLSMLPARHDLNFDPHNQLATP